jgi:hypothetical protein
MFNNFDNLDNAHNTWLDDLLAAQADALISDDEDFERADLTSDQAAQANELLELAFRVSESFHPVAPSEAFMVRLKDELVGEGQPAFLVRWRKLPPQYQLAAKLGGLTITAGIMLLAARTGINALESLQHRNEPKSDSNLSLNTASGA